MLIAGLSFYDEEIIAALCGMEDVDAVVLGDLFCGKRMFGDSCLLAEMMENVHGSGKKAVFQTPMYATERRFSKIAEMAGHLAAKGVLDGVIVQDTGLLRKLRSITPGGMMIWNCIDIGRSRVSNHLYYQTISQLGADSFLTGDAAAAEALDASGFSVIPVHGAMRYNTMNRECYYMYQHDIFDKDCSRGCVEREEYLVQPELGLEMRIDGHILGRKLDFSSREQISRLYREKDLPVCICADSIGEFAEHTAEITGA